MSNIIALILNEETNIYDRDSMYDIVPHIKKYNNQKIFSTHPNYISYDFIINKKIPIITTTRDPMDTVISYYYFYEKRKDNSEKIFDYCISNISDIIQISKKHHNFIKSYSNLLLVKFEDLVYNKEEEIYKIYNFIKSNYDINLKLNVNNILDKTDFLNTRKQEEKNGIYKVGKNQKTFFHRKGTKDQIFDEFTDEEIIQIKKYIKNNFPNYFEFFGKEYK